MFDHEGNPAFSHQEIYKTTETDERVPSTYRECVEMHLCPHCMFSHGLRTHVSDNDAARSEGFCSESHYQEYSGGVTLTEGYQSVKADIKHDHKLLAKSFGDDYYRLVRRAPERESLTVAELIKELKRMRDTKGGGQNDISEAA